MLFGRECYLSPETLLQMLGEKSVQAKASHRWVFPLVKIYIYLFGLPDISTQLRAQYFKRLTRKFKLGRVFDAGCGLGLYSSYLARKSPSAVIDACDYDPDLVKEGKAMLDKLGVKNVNIFQADLTQFAEHDKYDLIISQDVIDQIEDDGRLIQSFSDALREKGLLYLAIPHRRHTKRYFTKFEWESDKRHVREGYTEQGITELLENNGFKVKSLRNVWGVFGEGCLELYMLALLYLPLPLTALLFPILSTVASLDMVMENRRGYGIIIVAEKYPVKTQ